MELRWPAPEIDRRPVFGTATLKRRGDDQRVVELITRTAGDPERRLMDGEGDWRRRRTEIADRAERLRDLRPGGLPQSWGSRGYSHRRVRIVGGLEALSEAGAESAIIDGASNLKQQNRAAARPSHMLTFVHPTVHQKFSRPFGDRGAHPQSGTMAFGIIDQPVTLASQITVNRMYKAVHNFRDAEMAFPVPDSPLKWYMTTRMRSMLILAFVALPFHNRQCRRSTSPTITSLRRRPRR